MVGLIGQGILRDTLVPSYVMFAIAIPFLAIAANDSTRRWALIPGGVMAVIGLSLLAAGDAFQYLLPVALILAGVFVVARQFMGRDTMTEVEERPEIAPTNDAPADSAQPDAES
jgi:hypothetical protein